MHRHTTIALVLILLAGCSAGGGDVPDPPAAAAPLPTDDASPTQRHPGQPTVLEALRDDRAFALLPPAQDGDWRSGPGRDERPQTFPAYRDSRPVRATPARDRIVLQPLGPFSAEQRQVLEAMREFAATFFVAPVELASGIDLPATGQRTRTRRGADGGEVRWTQHHTRQLMRYTLRPKLTDQTLCLLGITMGDLYPEPSWNYVFGQAYLRLRVGVYSLARHEARFWDETTTPATRKRALRRGFGVLGHETGHMFGLEHCLHYACIMNGSNSLDESDRQPLWLCPVCLSKMAWNRGFDLAARYRALADFYTRQQLPQVAAWYADRAAALAR